MIMNLVLAFWALSIALAVTPGADWAYMISAGLRDRTVFPAVAGLMLGYVAITVVVSAGVGALVAGMPMLLTVLTIIGAAYLFWLGLGLLRHPPVPTAGTEIATVPAQWVSRGFGISGLNPKALLLFLALLPQFTSARAPWPISAQIGALGIIHMINCAVVYLLVGFGSGALLRSRPQAAMAVGRLSGAIMIVLAVILGIERLS